MKYSILLAITFIFILSCSPQKTANEQESDEQFSAFMTFYERFHTDSAFQMEHIVFPLSGLPSSPDSATLVSNNYYWQKEDWKLHRRFAEQAANYEFQFSEVLDGLIEEQIVHKNGNFRMKRHWSKREGEWYLIYFADMDMVGG